MNPKWEMTVAEAAALHAERGGAKRISEDFDLTLSPFQQNKDRSLLRR